MGVVFFTFIAVFCLIISAGALVFYREAMMKRLAGVVSPDVSEQLTGMERVRAAGVSIGTLVEPLERVLPRTAEETSVVQTRLIRAGYRQDSHLKMFYAAKVLVPVALAVLVTITGVYEWGAFFVYTVAAGLGFLAPDFWLGNRIAARQLEIRLGLPEVLDFMVICIEAGLSLDQAALRTADELRLGQPALSDELGLVNLEQRAGRARADAWKHLAERTDIDAVRALTALIVQVDQFGSSIAKALRVHAETLRTQRRQQAEEQAAKTAVKLVFPLVLFIFPSIFVVVLGPAMIILLESFEKYLLT
ncbi:MAG TPA: type II secretion system F family protein [Bryobacteraceae bacterium]|nr:type II secretion system F family protein [Bryobacteraceae bacterium]